MKVRVPTQTKMDETIGMRVVRLGLLNGTAMTAPMRRGRIVKQNCMKMERMAVMTAGGTASDDRGRDYSGHAASGDGGAEVQSGQHACHT